MKIGIVQTHAIGDIIIALPIAQYFIRNGCEVYWPIDDTHLEMFQKASDHKINFIPISRQECGFRSLEYFLSAPIDKLRELDCDNIFPLYNAMGEHGVSFINPIYSSGLKFDEYKYAITRVPFSEKWNLVINRDYKEETKLIEKLNIREEYILLHETAGDGERVEIAIPSNIREQYRVITISNITSSIFDWIPIYERASGIFFIDSAHANLVEQLNIGTNKHLKLRSHVSFTPVFKNGWTFI